MLMVCLSLEQATIVSNFLGLSRLFPFLENRSLRGTLGCLAIGTHHRCDDGRHYVSHGSIFARI